MDNTLNTERQLAARLVMAQAAAAVVVALLFVLVDGRSALGALAGGLLVAIATALQASRGLAASGAQGGVVWARLVVGTLVRWLVVIVGLYGLLVGLRWPPLAVVSGLAAALLAPLWRIFVNGKA